MARGRIHTRLDYAPATSTIRRHPYGYYWKSHGRHHRRHLEHFLAASLAKLAFHGAIQSDDNEGYTCGWDHDAERYWTPAIHRPPTMFNSGAATVSSVSGRRIPAD